MFPMHGGFMGRKKGVDPCAYVPGLYTQAEVDDLINIDGYIPVADADEFDKIRTGAVETMGGCSIWAGSYTTGVDKKYIQIFDIDFAAFGTWASGFLLFSGIYDGNELPITNLTSSQALFASTASGFAVKNMRVSGTFSTADSSGNGKAPIIGNCNTGIVDNNHYIGNVTNTLSPVEQNLAGIVGLINSTNITIKDNVYLGGLSGGGNHIGFIIGRGSASGIMTITGNQWGGSHFHVTSGNIIGPLAGSLANANVGGHSNAVDITGGLSIGGIVGRTISGTVIITDCINTGNIASNQGNIGGIVGDSSGAITTITNSYNEGNITHTGLQTTIASGGIIGLLNTVASAVNTTTIERCYNSGDITSYRYAGGIVGAGSATIRESYNEGEVFANQFFAGGLMARNNNGIVQNCYNIGLISTASGGASGIVDSAGTSTLENSFSAAIVTGSLIAGVARVGTPVVMACYWDTTIGPPTSPAAGTGQTTTTLQTPTSNTGIYSAWSLAIWDFGTSTDYPELINTP